MSVRERRQERQRTRTPPGGRCRRRGPGPDMRCRRGVPERRPTAGRGRCAGRPGAPRPRLGPNCAIPFRLFPADNPWNTDISALPVDANSADYIAAMGAETEIHADFGTVWNGAPNGIPYVCVRVRQPGCRSTSSSTAARAIRGRTRSRRTPHRGRAASDADRHVLVLDVDNQMLYELYHAYPRPTARGTRARGRSSI